MKTNCITNSTIKFESAHTPNREQILFNSAHWQNPED